jgi:hypothetical protein
MPDTPFSLTDFRAALPGGGARPNLFEVLLSDNPMGGSNSIAGTAGSLSTTLCKAASMPGSKVTSIDVPFRGRSIRVPGVREFDESWTTTVFNDTDFAFRRMIEEWMDNIASHEANIGEFDLTKLSTDLFVYQLDHADGKRIRGYKFVNAWPSELSVMELAADTNDSIQEFDITWTFSYWMQDDQEVTARGAGGTTTT